MRWLSIDPGDMTGWALWHDTELFTAGQTPNWNFVDLVVDRYFDRLMLFSLPEITYEPDAPVPSSPPSIHDPEPVELLVIEDFVLYPWKAQDLAWDALETPRIIGALTLVARQRGLGLVFQGANVKERAQAGGSAAHYLSPIHENRHANDAIDHGQFYAQTELLNQAPAPAPAGERGAGG